MLDGVFTSIFTSCCGIILEFPINVIEGNEIAGMGDYLNILRVVVKCVSGDFNANTGMVGVVNGVNDGDGVGRGIRESIFLILHLEAAGINSCREGVGTRYGTIRRNIKETGTSNNRPGHDAQRIAWIGIIGLTKGARRIREGIALCHEMSDVVGDGQFIHSRGHGWWVEILRSDVNGSLRSGGREIGSHQALLALEIDVGASHVSVRGALDITCVGAGLGIALIAGRADAADSLEMKGVRSVIGSNLEGDTVLLGDGCNLGRTHALGPPITNLDPPSVRIW